MKERPILFSGPMVRALLAGSKTQTRRVIKDQSIGERFSHMTEDGRAHLEWLGTPCCGTGVWDVPEYSAQVACPYGQPGDRLWVRESFMPVPLEAAPGPSQTPWSIAYAAGSQTELLAPSSYNPTLYNYERWTPSIHMPRWASRITLEITSVRVERLQDISEADALAEGIVRQPDDGFGLADTTHYHYTDPRNSYWSLWESINGDGSVEANPWVWVVEFKPVATTR